MKFNISDYKKIAELPGIYKFLDGNRKIIYIGKAINLKRRISSYFQNRSDLDDKTRLLVSHIKYIDVTLVTSDFEALLLEARLIKTHKPKYNVIWKDDRHYIYLKVTREKFPRVLFARRNDDDSSIFFGPFHSRYTVRDLLAIIRTIIPFCSSPVSKRACFYTHLGLCSPCPSEIVKKMGMQKSRLTKQYGKNIKNIINILTGKSKKVENFLKREMKYYSDREMYEKAAYFREKINNLKMLQKKNISSQNYLDNPRLASQIWHTEQRNLLEILKNLVPGIASAKTLEAYDISNISGSHAAGSMVTFADGIPDKNNYRRFRIKTVHKQDDFAMIAEVLQRRLNHRDWTYPQLIIIDGGKPQLTAAIKLLNELKIEIPVIGIAKEFDRLVIPSNNDYIYANLPQDSPALHLIQRIRDEAHRFAHKYHQKIRLKKLLGQFEH